MVPLSYLPFNTLVWPLSWQIIAKDYKLNQIVAPFAAS